MGPLLEEIAIFLAAAVIAVPIAQRLGLGSVLGYLAAGVIIGPWALGLIGDVEQVLHIAEFGVVLLLFIIGLEMQPRRLWALRKTIIGLGGMQVGLSAAALALAASLVLEMPPVPAIVAGLALALSSTAFALQLLAERGELNNPVVLEREVRRMLADPRAGALSTRFAAQWLRLDDLEKVTVNAMKSAFIHFDERLALIDDVIKPGYAVLLG